MRPVLPFLLLLLAASLRAAPLSLDQIDCLAELHLALKAQLAEMNEVFGEPEALVRYEQEYRQAVREQTAEITPVADLEERLAGAELVLFGDTHTEIESQENTIEALRAMRRGDGPVTLVIEWIDRSFQAEVDAFLAGETDGATLREAVEYDRHWSFSWEHYLPVLEAARELGAGVLLVEDHLHRQELGDRDRDIATLTLTHRARNPGRRYLVAYGSYHTFGRGHLPDLFVAGGLAPDAVLLGEAPEVYFRALRKVRDPERLRFVRLGPGLYFVENGTPVERERETRDRFMGYAGWLEEDFRVRTPDCGAARGSRELFHELHHGLD